MSKRTLITFYWDEDEPPYLGFVIKWYTDLSLAENSTELYSGFFKSKNSGGFGNIHVFGDVMPDVDTDFSGINIDGIVSTYSDIVNVSNTMVRDIISMNPMRSINLSNSDYDINNIPPNIDTGATLRIGDNGFLQNEIDEFLNYIIDKGLNIENKGNEDVSIKISQEIEAYGGKVWENDVGICKFQTTAPTTTSFTFFINAGADVDWYLDGVEHTSNSNNATFNFTDSSIKTIEIRGTDVSQGKWLVTNSKSLTGTFDLSAMINSSARIDFSDNPDLTEVILPRTSGVFDQLMGFNSGITTLRLDKLTNLINSPNIQIRLGDCPNLNTNSVVNNILLIDADLVSGRQFWTNGTTPNMSSKLKIQLENNNWTIVE